MTSVLIIDDHEDTCRLLVQLFHTCGLDADSVTSGTDAIRWVRNRSPDFVLLDFMMPDLDGLDTLRKLRGFPTGERIPIVIHTAVSDPKFREFAQDCGATDVWTKGQYDISQMMDRMTVMLAKSSSVNA